MVIEAIAAGWVLMLLLVYALCRASAAADTPMPLLKGDVRRVREIRSRR
jgi:hypothetical protein